MVDIIARKAEPPGVGRQLLMHILTAFVNKLRSLSQWQIPLAMKHSRQRDTASASASAAAGSSAFAAAVVGASAGAPTTPAAGQPPTPSLGPVPSLADGTGPQAMDEDEAEADGTTELVLSVSPIECPFEIAALSPLKCRQVGVCVDDMKSSPEPVYMSL